MAGMQFDPSRYRLEWATVFRNRSPLFWVLVILAAGFLCLVIFVLMEPVRRERARDAGEQGETVVLNAQVLDAMQIENFPQAVACIFSDGTFRVLVDQAGTLKESEKVSIDPRLVQVLKAKRTASGDVAAFLGTKNYPRSYGVVVTRQFSLVKNGYAEPRVQEAFENAGMTMEPSRVDPERNLLNDVSEEAFVGSYNLHYPKNGTDQLVGSYRTSMGYFDVGTKLMFWPPIANTQLTAVIASDAFQMGCLFYRDSAARWQTSRHLTFRQKPVALIVDSSQLYVFEKGVAERFALNRILPQTR